MFENRTDQTGHHYVVDGTSGQLAHRTLEDGRQMAAVNLSDTEAADLAAELNKGAS